ncbi:carbonic anhydrase 4-like [Myxocyprinus asiaticus]|uniref:carbonic anhydrase 4-like n=1 Tax=Myxocyprinus asiaticus TaxID=70543 RepID=UPI002223D89E|nr:carbonic anhydrase 4-like [Myxocyprinus asiaticus]
MIYGHLIKRNATGLHLFLHNIGLTPEINTTVYIESSATNCETDWCYQSQVTCSNTCRGPDEWATIATTCGGRKQSPINIVTKQVIPDHRLTPVQFTGYQQSFSGIIKNSGHTVQVDLPNTAVITGASLGTAYKAQQLHLHWGKNGGPGSEHTIDGEQYPMELHIVHIKETYNSLQEAVGDPSGVAVLGFFYEESKSANKKYESIINSLINIKLPGTNATLETMSLDMLIPSHETLGQYFRYQGSLTTPGCSEAVVWTVFEKPITLSKEQLSAFSSLQFGNETAMVDTYRPVQSRNGCEVSYSMSIVVCVSTTLLVSSVFTTISVLTV